MYHIIYLLGCIMHTYSICDVLINSEMSEVLTRQLGREIYEYEILWLGKSQGILFCEQNPGIIY